METKLDYQWLLGYLKERFEVDTNADTTGLQAKTP